MKRKIIPSELSVKDRHQFLIGSIAPRPIAFVSTIDGEGRPNLAPYSFFNAFSSTPPIVVFSSNRKVRDNTTKDTLSNVRKNRGLVISMVNYNIARQMVLTSVEFAPGISEFEKSGLTPEPASIVSAPLVKESPVNLECRVNDIITLGEQGGAGHLIICEVLAMHIEEDVIGDNNRIDPHKIDLIGRLGRSYYVRASGDNVETIHINASDSVIGFDGLPEHIVNSNNLTGNMIAKMAGLTSMPNESQVAKVKATYNGNAEETAKKLLDEGKVMEALALLM